MRGMYRVRFFVRNSSHSYSQVSIMIPLCNEHESTNKGTKKFNRICIVCECHYCLRNGSSLTYYSQNNEARSMAHIVSITLWNLTCQSLSTPSESCRKMQRLQFYDSNSVSVTLWDLYSSWYHPLQPCFYVMSPFCSLSIQALFSSILILLSGGDEQRS